MGLKTISEDMANRLRDFGSDITREQIQAWKDELDQILAEPQVARYDFDGHGYRYMDNGSGSDWVERTGRRPDCEYVYKG